MLNDGAQIISNESMVFIFFNIYIYMKLFRLKKIYPSNVSFTLIVNECLKQTSPSDKRKLKPN